MITPPETVRAAATAAGRLLKGNVELPFPPDGALSSTKMTEVTGLAETVATVTAITRVKDQRRMFPPVDTAFQSASLICHRPLDLPRGFLGGEWRRTSAITSHIAILSAYSRPKGLAHDTS
jgi:hypothetical protein